VIDVYAAPPAGHNRYDPVRHCLALKRARDVRSLTGYQDFVGMVPLDLVYVANHGRMQDSPSGKRRSSASPGSPGRQAAIAAACSALPGMASMIGSMQVPCRLACRACISGG
jgi:hypothetical protein